MGWYTSKYNKHSYLIDSFNYNNEKKKSKEEVDDEVR